MKSESNTVTAHNLNRLYQWRRDRPSAAEMKSAIVVSSERIPPNVVAMDSQVLRLRLLKVLHQAEAERRLRLEFGFLPGVF